MGWVVRILSRNPACNGCYGKSVRKSDPGMSVGLSRLLPAGTEAPITGRPCTGDDGATLVKGELNWYDTVTNVSKGVTVRIIQLTGFC